MTQKGFSDTMKTDQENLFLKQRKAAEKDLKKVRQRVFFKHDLEKEGDWMAVTIADIAKEAGVSISTVSRVMNGTKPVSPELKKRVDEVVEKNHFKPNTLAKGLVTKKTNMIGVVVTDISNAIYGSMTRGINSVCEEQGYNIMICESHGEHKREEKILALLEEKQVDGVLFVGMDINEELLDIISCRSYPVVLVSQEASAGEGRIPTVVHDNTRAMEDAVRFLIDNGHRRIAYLGGPGEDYSSGKKRLMGYRLALEKAGIEVPDTYIQQGAFSFGAGHDGMKRIYEENSILPTAVAAGSDVIAVGAIQFLCSVGLRVPEDISIIGFDDADFAAYVQPELATVRVSYFDEGQTAARKLMEQMSGEAGKPETCYIPHKIIRRRTVKVLRQEPVSPERK